MTLPQRAARAACAWTSVLVFVAGCASHKDRVLPQDGPTMQQIYQEHFARLRLGEVEGARAALAGAPRPLAAGAADLRGYTRAAHTEIESVFARLPNPTLVMFVYPHLAQGVPVPGYATSFPLYEHVQYALPGEVPGR